MTPAEKKELATEFLSEFEDPDPVAARHDGLE